MVRTLDDQVIESFKARTSRPVERVAAECVVNIAGARSRAERIKRSLDGRPHSGSAALIREDRER